MHSRRLLLSTFRPHGPCALSIRHAHSQQQHQRCFSALPLLSPERPRLEALRKRLSEETVVPVQQFQVDQNSKQPQTTTTTRTSIHNHPKQNQKSTKQPKPLQVHRPSIHEILKQLEQQQPIIAQNILTDKFQRHHSYLRLSLTERCNLRCRYCMPPEGVPLQPPEHLLTNEEILTLTRLFCRHGVSKVRLTGGEPLLRKDLVQLVDGLSQLSSSSQHITPLEQIGMTTNGITLSRHMQDLVNAGLTHVNISLDTLQQDKFVDMTRRPGLSKVLHGMETACRLLSPAGGRVKLNCVVMRGVNENELYDFMLLTRQFPIDVRFIEWMPFNDNGWNQNRFVSYADMLRQVEEQHGVQLERLEDGPNDTTKWYRLPHLDSDDDDGTNNATKSSSRRIGFITSMSQHFCGTCNRLRLTADGQIKVCLFGSTEVSLRDALRSGVSVETLERLIHYAVSQKHYKLGGHESAEHIHSNSDTNRPMTLIGG